jgi:hypothetical protein
MQATRLLAHDHTVIEHASSPLLRYRPPPKHDLGVRIRCLAHNHKHGLWPALTLTEPDIVPECKEGECHLNLVAGEKPARACVLASAEIHVCVADARELPPVGGLGVALLAHAVEAQRVKGLRVREEALVVRDAGLWSQELGPRREVGAVREFDGLYYFANEGC